MLWITVASNGGDEATGYESRAVSFKATQRSARPRGVAEMVLAGDYCVRPMDQQTHR